MKKSKNSALPIQLRLYLQKAISCSENLPTRKELIHWVKCALQAVPAATYQNNKNLEITVRLVDETESASLNQQYRHKTGPTNILSFPFKNRLDNEVYYLGDLVICVPLVFQEAIEQSKSSLAHWAHLTLHGVLHLIGYDHVNDSEALVMEALEVNILEQLGYKNPYIRP